MSDAEGTGATSSAVDTLATATANGAGPAFAFVFGSDAMKPFAWFAGAVLAVCLLASMSAVGIAIYGVSLMSAHDMAMADRISANERISSDRIAANERAMMAAITSIRDETRDKIDTHARKVDKLNSEFRSVEYWSQRAEISMDKAGVKVPPAPQPSARNANAE